MHTGKNQSIFFLSCTQIGAYRDKMQRPQRNRKAPVPLYVPDANQVMEDDFSGEEDDDDDDDGESIGESDSDVSYSGSEPNEYVYDDFLVPDEASVSQETQGDDEEEEELDSSDTESSDEEESEEDDDEDVEMAAPPQADTDDK